MHRLLCFSLGLGLFFIAACENPTGVGRDLIGETDKQLATARVQPESVDQLDSLALITGSTSTNPQQLRRVLVGQVSDPPFGATAATGYVDFQTSEAGIPDTAAIQRISLELPRSYLYGDSSQALSLHLRNMPADWDPSGATADTTLEAGSLVGDYEVAPGDSLISLPLPEDWIADREEALRDTTFEDVFYGFQLAPQAGNAVIGLDPTAPARFQIETDTDTLVFPLDQTLTTLSRSSPASPPEDRLLVQNGVGPQVLFRFNFASGQRTDVDADSLMTLTGNIPNRAELVLQADTTLSAPPNFVRPQLNALALYATRDDGEEFLLAENVFLNEDGQFEISTGDINRAVQLILQGDNTFTRFRVGPGLTGGNSAQPVSITPVLLYGESASCPQGGNACTPAFHLTLSLAQ